MIDNMQKHTVVHVNRLKRFNNREIVSTPATLPNNQAPPEITKAVPKGEEKSSSNNQPMTSIKRGRGRPRKNVPQNNNPTRYPPPHNHPTPQQPRNEQKRRPGRPRRRDNKQFTIETERPYMRYRLRSASRRRQDYQLREPVDIERRHRVINNYSSTNTHYQRQITPPTISRHNGVCFPFAQIQAPFFYHYPDCIHQRLRRGTLIRNSEEPPRFWNHNPEYPRREIPNPIQSRYNLRPRH
jgi:hypothetical protein